MAQFVAKTCYLTLAGVDLSDHVVSATLTSNSEIIDSTAMGSTTTSRSFLGGLLNWQLEVEFQSDYATGKVESTLTALVGTSVAMVFRPATGAKAAGNPEYTGNAFLESFPVIANTVGELAKTRLMFRGTGALSRTT